MITYNALHLIQFLNKVLKTRQTMIRKGVSRLPDLPTVDKIQKLRALLAMKPNRSLREASALFVNKVEAFRELLPGGARNLAGRAMRAELEAMYLQSLAVNNFYSGDPTRINFPFFLKKVGETNVVKICGPTTICLVSRREEPNRQSKTTEGFFSMDQYQELMLDSTWVPCHADLFRQVLFQINQDNLAMLDTSHRIAPRSDREAVDNILQTAIQRAASS